MPDIEIADAITALRHQLTRAMQDGEGEILRFSVTSLDLRLSVVITSNGHGHAGVKFWVIEAGGAVEHSHESIQEVTLHLLPVEPPGRPVRLASSPTTPSQ